MNGLIRGRCKAYQPQHRYRGMNSFKLPASILQSVQLLMDHTVPGVTGTYLHDRALFNTLLGEQERISEYLMGLLEPAE